MEEGGFGWGFGWGSVVVPAFFVAVLEGPPYSFTTCFTVLWDLSAYSPAGVVAVEGGAGEGHVGAGADDAVLGVTAGLDLG